MLELNSQRKHKVNLADYNSQQDIDNRILLSDLSPLDVRVLEELLFSPLKVSAKKLARTLDIDEQECLPIVSKLARTGLLSIHGDLIEIDKEMRKYFEFQLQRFDPEFRPDIEFMQGLLRKVPIHVLPTWYSISRSSNNIFESIVEKYLLTPQAFKRHLTELGRNDPVTQAILRDLYASPNLELSSSDVIAKYNLSRHSFEETMLLLEYNFACAVRYVGDDDHWHEIITPFREWHQYVQFLRETEAPILPETSVHCLSDRDFAFIEEMASVLQSLPSRANQTPVVDKLILLKFVDSKDGKLRALDAATDWLAMSLENRSLFLYRHPTNPLLSTPSAREAEKSICRVLHGGWVALDQFMKGVMVPLNADATPMLKKFGNQWKYLLPSYTDADLELIKASICELLFECGMVAIGTTRENRDCFRVTSLGRYFFEK